MVQRIAKKKQLTGEALHELKRAGAESKGRQGVVNLVFPAHPPANILRRMGKEKGRGHGGQLLTASPDRTGCLKRNHYIFIVWPSWWVPDRTGR